jgi:hypothetical protein
MQLHSDWIALLREFSAAGVEYLLVGAAAIAYYGTPRGTADMDVWVRPRPENARLVYDSLANFGAPIEQVTVHDFEVADMVWQLGVAPLRVDILTDIEGVCFDDAWTRREHAVIEGIEVPVISRLADLELLGEQM